jgi:D-3-phosphoglycerate dehydrogenase
VDNVDVEAATARGIVVMNAPDGNTIATAELTLGLMLALARHIVPAAASLAAGEWKRKAFQGTELNGKTLGIVGLGRVGRAVAQRACAFGMHIIATDPCLTAEQIEQCGAECVTWDDLLARADYITLHAPLSEDTRCLIDADALAAMKDGVRIINAARGALVDAGALADAIRRGKVAGAAIDVYTEEPPPSDHPLIGLPGVVHTPHLGASTAEAQAAVAVQAARQVIEALTAGEYNNVINPEVL